MSVRRVTVHVMKTLLARTATDPTLVVVKKDLPETERFVRVC